VLTNGLDFKSVNYMSNHGVTRWERDLFVDLTIR